MNYTIEELREKAAQSHEGDDLDLVLSFITWLDDNAGSDHPVPENERGSDWLANDGRDCRNIPYLNKIIADVLKFNSSKEPYVLDITLRKI